MTARERNIIRHARDADVRSRIERLRFAYERGSCKACGFPLDERNPSCYTCGERARQRRNRAVA